MGFLKKTVAKVLRGLRARRGVRPQPPPPPHPSLCATEFIEAVCRHHQQENPTDIDRDVKKTINSLLDSRHDLLSLPPPPPPTGGEECDTLWRWLVRNNHADVVNYVAFNASERNWTIPANKTDPRNGSSLFTDPAITMSYDMFCALHYVSGELFDGVVNKMTNESVLHILAKRNDVYGNGMALKIMKEVMINSCANTDPDLVDKLEGKTALDYALARGDTAMAWVLVNAFGADWGLAEAKASEQTTTTTAAADCVMHFLRECRRLYGIQPNVSTEAAATREETSCVVCLEDVVYGDMYKMSCCGNVLHTECLRKSLRHLRGVVARCMICREDLCDELFFKMPGFSFGLSSATIPLSLLLSAARGYDGPAVAESVPPLHALAALVDYVLQ